MKEKLLVINPDYSSWPEWPVGMAYVLACLETNGVPFDFVDCTTTKNYGRILRKKLQNEKYLAVASGGLIGSYHVFRDIAKLVSTYAHQTPFILGGHIVKDGNDKLLFETIGIDYGILGEVETSLPAFLHALERGTTDFTGFTGVFFKNESGEVVRNKQERINLAEENIIPAWHHFDAEYYISHSAFSFLGKHLRYIPVLSGRGCIGKCGFCSPSVGGFKKRPIAYVLEEIQFLMERFDFDTICFLNEMFYPTAKEIREFCYAYLKMEKRKEWFVQVRVDANLDVETLRLMKEAGCIAVSAGIESGSDNILKQMNKKSTASQIRKHFRNCREAGMPANGTVIIGYDGETEEDMKKTFDLLIEEDISSGEALLFAYQGTQVYDKACRIGLIADEDKHLDAISGNLFRPTVMDEFCNLSAMSDAEFFSNAPREVRRYNSHLMQGYAVQELQTKINGNWRWTKISMAGHCSRCGAPIGHDFISIGGEFQGSLGPGVDRLIACRRCFSPTIFNPYLATNFPDMQGHLEAIRNRVARSKRVVLAGVNNNLDFLLRSDCYGLNYDTILGVYPTRAFNLSRYMIYPVMDEEALCAADADLILCTEDSYDVSLLTAIYKQYGCPLPDIVYLTSRGFRRELKKQTCLVFKVNQMTKKAFGMTAREMLHSISLSR